MFQTPDVIDDYERTILRMESAHGSLGAAIEWAELHACSHIGEVGEEQARAYWEAIAVRGRTILKARECKKTTRL